MTIQAKGTFDTTTTPHPPYDTGEGATLARMTITKVWKGAIEGTSVVEMLSAMTAVKGSAGYVAIERVNGTLDGRAGSFVLQHTGTMNRGAAALSVTVVPDSGTGQLEGLAGAMTIAVVERTHHFTFEYTLPGAG